MAEARNFNELRMKMPLESRARVEERVKATLANMALDQLRAARELTQENLAQIFGVSQGSISRLEHRTDMYVSTLAKFIEAMGGQLEIRAVFPDGAVRINRFGGDANRAG
jgi:DNA-binding XRE family transcriptional regulator